MQVVRCTAKLLKELRVPSSDLRNVQDDGFLGSWFANLLRLDRRKCILFTNSTTLYSVLVPGVRRAELSDLDRLFVTNLLDKLGFEAIGDGSKRIIIGSLPIVLAKTNSRSVLGSMNDLAFLFETYIRDDQGLSNCDMDEIHRKVNRSPMSAIRYSTPIECLRKRLNEVST